MTDDEVRAGYAANLTETITVRRYSGIGIPRPKTDYQARGKAMGYDASQIAGSIQQGDRKVLVFVDDLVERGLELPMTSNDKVVIGGKEFSVINPGMRNGPQGALILYDLQVRG